MIERCLGRGGFGEVYAARMTTPGGLTKEVAIKLLLDGLDPSSQAVQRLRDEGKLLASLAHPVILDVHDVVTLAGRVALVTELVDGQDLAELLKPPGPIPLRAALQVISGVASALHAAWTSPARADQPLQLVHRDIKPSNIRISRHGVVKLLDFGIARSDELTREAHTGTNMMIGTLRYMAPERFQTTDPHPGGDVFALGCCLYETLVPERFYAGLSAPLLMGTALDPDRYEVFRGQRLAKLPANTDPEARALIDEMLCYRPDARPTAAQVAHRCSELADELLGPNLWGWCQQRSWPLSTVAPGPLDGQTLTEGSAAPVVPVGKPRVNHAPVETASLVRPARKGRAGMWLGVGGTAAAMLALGGLLLGLLSLGGWWAWSEMSGASLEPAEPAPSSSEQPANEGVPSDAGLSAADAPGTPDGPILSAEERGSTNSIFSPTPTAAARDGAGSGAASEAAAGRVPSASEGVAAGSRPSSSGREGAQPSGQAAGVVQRQGEVPIQLRRAGARFQPGPLAPGRYRLWADYGAGFVQAGAVDVVAGGRVVVSCNGLLQSCQVR